MPAVPHAGTAEAAPFEPAEGHGELSASALNLSHDRLMASACTKPPPQTPRAKIVPTFDCQLDVSVEPSEISGADPINAI